MPRYCQIMVGSTQVMVTPDGDWRVEITDRYRVWWKRAELQPVRTPEQLDALMRSLSGGRQSIADLVEA